MKIGERSAKTGTQVETIQYYEREGLLLDAGRTQSNYRVYDRTHLARLTFIRHCRALDMTLGEIRVLLKFKAAPGANCGEVNALLDEHVERIRELRLHERQLRMLRALCHETQDTEHCGILDELGHVAAKVATTAFGAAAHLAVHSGAQGRGRVR